MCGERTILDKPITSRSNYDQIEPLEWCFRLVFNSKSRDKVTNLKASIVVLVTENDDLDCIFSTVMIKGAQIEDTFWKKSL